MRLLLVRPQRTDRPPGDSIPDGDAAWGAPEAAAHTCPRSGSVLPGFARRATLEAQDADLTIAHH